MRRRRRPQEEPFSLFSFQDIITSLTGIMIILVLLLVLEVATITDRQVPSPEHQEQDLELHQRITELRRQLELLPEPPELPLWDLTGRL